MNAKTFSYVIISGLLFLYLACGGSDAQQTHSTAQAGEPIDLIVDLVIEEAWTMDEVAKALTKQTGVQFVLSPEIDPHKRLQDPYMIMSFDLNLKEHLDELEAMGLWSFTWKDGKYHIHEL